MVTVTRCGRQTMVSPGFWMAPWRTQVPSGQLGLLHADRAAGNAQHVLSALVQAEHRVLVQGQFRRDLPVLAHDGAGRGAARRAQQQGRQRQQDRQRDDDKVASFHPVSSLTKRSKVL